MAMNEVISEEKGTCKNYFKNEEVQRRNIEFTRLWTEVINQKEKEIPIIFQRKDSILHSQIS